MIQLKKEYYYLCKKLKNSKFKSPEAYSVIEMYTPGVVFVDNITLPRIAIVYSQGMAGFYLLGEVEDKEYFNSIKNKIFFIISLFAKNIGLESIEISAESSEGNKRIEELFDNSSLKYEYQLVHETCYLEKRIEETGDFEILFVTRELDLDQFINKEFFMKEIKRFWGNIDKFYEFGQSTILVKDNMILSICYTGSIYRKRQTMGIITHGDYQGNEYAYKVGYVLIRKLRKDGILPYWDCMKDNTSSLNLAEKLGFIITNKYRCYWINIDLFEYKNH